MVVVGDLIVQQIRDFRWVGLVCPTCVTGRPAVRPWNSRPTLYLTHASTSCCQAMPLSSLPRRPTTNSSQLLRSRCQFLNRHPCLWSAILVMESTWHAAWCTGAMSFQRMWMLLWLPSRPSELSNSWTGHRQVSWNQKDACSVCLIVFFWKTICKLFVHYYKYWKALWFSRFGIVIQDPPSFVCLAFENSKVLKN